MTRDTKANASGGRMLKAASALVASAVVGGFAASASAATYEGAPVMVGEGFARVVVETDAADKPDAISVLLSRDALGSLPPAPNPDNKEGAWLYPLPMPEGGPSTGFRTVVIDWMPHGHPPPHIYSVPHFDFHFYTMEAADIDRIRFSGPDDPLARVSDSSLLADGYQVVAETAVDRMGVHAIDTTAAEFHGKPFTSTLIYGYYDGALVFVEPMVTRDFLISEPDFTAAVKRPAHISRTGHYPSNYEVRYDAAGENWKISLTGLEYRTDTAAGSH